MLPREWVEVSLAEVGRWGSGGTPKASDASFYNGNLPWVRSGDLPDGPITSHEFTISEAGLANSSAKWVDEGAVLIAMYGATIGKLGITTYPVTTNQAIAFIQPSVGVDARFLFENLRYRKPVFVALGQGGAQPNVSQEILKAQPFLLPPLAEQRRIVAKLDAATARLSLARAELDRVSVLADRLRDATLTAVREAISQYPISEVSALAETTFDGPFGSNLKSVDYTEGGARVVRLENIGHLRFIADKRTYISLEKYGGLTRHTLAPGDILFSSFVDREVRVCLFPDDIAEPTINKADCFVVRPNAAKCEGKFLAYMLATPSTYETMKDAVHGATRPRIGLSELKAYRINLPPKDVQRSMASQIEAAFARADRLEAEATRARALLDRLEAAILAKAFRGELVPQDPADEPATTLLARIRTQRAAAPTAKRGRRAKADA